MPRSGVAEKLTILHFTMFARKQLTFDPVPPVLRLLEVDELGGGGGAGAAQRGVAAQGAGAGLRLEAGLEGGRARHRGLGQADHLHTISLDLLGNIAGEILLGSHGLRRFIFGHKNTVLRDF